VNRRSYFGEELNGDIAVCLPSKTHKKLDRSDDSDSSRLLADEIYATTLDIMRTDDEENLLESSKKAKF